VFADIIVPNFAYDPRADQASYVYSKVDDLQTPVQRHDTVRVLPVHDDHPYILASYGSCTTQALTRSDVAHVAARDVTRPALTTSTFVPEDSSNYDQPG